MIASWRGLLIAIGVAIALAIAVIAGGAPPAVVDHAIAPGFAADGVTGLRWRGGGSDLTVRRRPGAAITDDDAWQLVTDRGAVPADGNAIHDAIAALRGGRWQRAAGVIASHRGLVVDGATPHVIGIGASLPGDAQAWISVDGRGLLVDGWIARALDVSLLGVRAKSPLDRIGAAHDVVLTDAAGTLHIEPGPIGRIVLPSGARFVASQIPFGFLVRALADLTMVRLPDDASAPAHGLTITVSPPSPARVGTLTLGGPCAGAPALVAVASPWGDGCVEAEAARAITDRVAAYHAPAEAFVSRAVIADEVRRVTLLDGTRIDLTTGKVGDAPGNPQLLGKLVTSLEIGDLATVVPRPTGQPTGVVTVDGASGQTVTLACYPPREVVRDDEPFALRLDDELWGLLHGTARTFRDLTPWLEEPTTVTQLQIDAVRFVRGDVIGAWRRVPGGPVPAADAAQLEALVKDVAQPRVLGDGDAPVAPHTLTLTVAPPVGAPTTHRLVVGTQVGARCPARAGADPISLPPEVCQRVAALAR